MNNHDQIPTPPSQLEKAMNYMREIDVPEVPQAVVAQTGSAMLLAASRNQWGTQLQRVAAVAAVLIFSIGVIALIAQSSPSSAFAQLVDRVNSTKTIRAKVVRAPENGILLVSGTRMRMEMGDTISISDSATGKKLQLDNVNKVAMQNQDAAMGLELDFYGLFRKLASSAAKPIEDYVDKAGQRIQGFQGVTEFKVGSEISKIRARVWTNPETKLPMRLAIGPADDDNPKDVLLLEDIEFDGIIDPTLFSMEIPAGYTRFGVSPDQLRPKLNEKEAAKLTIRPGVGIGEVKFGMSRNEVASILGEPEFVMHDICLCYPSKGLQLVLTGPGSTLGSIIANPADAASLTRNDFPGQTDAGIRMGANEKQVREAYGEPDPQQPGGQKSMHSKIIGYSKLGLGFNFIDDKLVQIFASDLSRVKKLQGAP